MEWVKCYRVWRSMVISKWFLNPEMTDRYCDRMNKYAHDYPAYLWPLLYQADVRARQERLARIARRLRAEKEEADKDGQRHPYDPAKPWERPFHDLVVNDDKFWEREFEKPADAISWRLLTRRSMATPPSRPLLLSTPRRRV